ncbi:C39 family peptidase [Nocardia sp. NPDC057227]|uniref:C39 family peptidase n=1 Tax=Nocardia sp. NPDC057227 TaxID=3346056 RepID=UPI0036392921
MTERVLDYDRAVVRQETGWWCGPASTQTVLNSLGIVKPERDFMRELEDLEGNTGWDDQDGTDSIRQITTVLNGYAPGYVTRQLPNDPPTAEQVDLLWRDITASIDAGFGVVANIDAPVSNYPRGVKGSTSPRYGGGEVLHYFAVMGYDDDPRLRAVWIADSGFPPYGYWMSFDQLASLIPPKGYSANLSGAKKRTADEELSKRYLSRSKYRADDDEGDTLAGYILNIDARVHERSIEGRA